MCTIEEALSRELIWIPCRHHVHEILLSATFNAVFGPTAGPETGLFKRFQKTWRSIDHSAYVCPMSDLFQDYGFDELRNEMLAYLTKALCDHQPRADYKELLELTYIFLGGQGTPIKFRLPGPTHHARWMQKALYALKIFLFRDQFDLTARELKAIKSLALFVSLVYVRAWNEAQQAIRAPLNDFKLLRALRNYPDKTISIPATAALERHLWFFSEHLVGLSFFDDRLGFEVKRNMVKRRRTEEDGHFQTSETIR